MPVCNECNTPRSQNKALDPLGQELQAIILIMWVLRNELVSSAEAASTLSAETFIQTPKTENNCVVSNLIDASTTQLFP